MDIYLFKVNNSNTRTICNICSKLKLKTFEWRQFCHSGVFFVIFEQILHLALVFLLLTLNRQMLRGYLVSLLILIEK